MTRYWLVPFFSVALVFAADDADSKLLQKAKEIHKRMIAFDTHVDLPFDYAGASADGKAQIDLPKIERGQLKGAAVVVVLAQGPPTTESNGKGRGGAGKKKRQNQSTPGQ